MRNVLMMGGYENGTGFKARVITDFRGVRDGETRVSKFKPGDQISGDLARVAIAQGWAKAMGAAPENKAAEVGQGPFQTGPAKRSSSRPAGRAKGKATSRGRKAKPKSS